MIPISSNIATVKYIKYIANKMIPCFFNDKNPFQKKNKSVKINPDISVANKSVIILE